MTASKTATVSKPGAEVKVTVGKPEVVINGESRPLDVPPMVYQGVVVVPVRVISEGMGAYVQWVPDRRPVVVRYIPATSPPSPAPPPPAAPPPPPPPPTPHPLNSEFFVAGDYVFSPKVYNAVSPGNTGTSTFAIRGAGEFALGNIPFMVEGNFERWQYPHNCNGTSSTAAFSPECYVTTIGGQGNSPVLTNTQLNDQNVDARLAVRVLNPRVYIGVGYMWVTSNYGYPNMNGVGFRLKKLLTSITLFPFFGSVWYYPDINGTYSNLASAPINPKTYDLQYNILNTQVGLNYVIGNSPIFIQAGWHGLSVEQ